MKKQKQQHSDKKRDEVVVVLEDFEKLQNVILFSELALLKKIYDDTYSDRIQGDKGGKTS